MTYYVSSGTLNATHSLTHSGNNSEQSGKIGEFHIRDGMGAVSVLDIEHTLLSTVADHYVSVFKKITFMCVCSCVQRVLT